MVGIGTALLALSAWYALAWWRRRDLPRSRLFLRATTISGVLAVVALEAGWVVTEVGRQPWTVVGHLLDPGRGRHVRQPVAVLRRHRRAVCRGRRHHRVRPASAAPPLARAGRATETDVPYGPPRASESAPTGGQA